jgi:hypothetical protein
MSFGTSRVVSVVPHVDFAEESHVAFEVSATDEIAIPNRHLIRVPRRMPRVGAFALPPLHDAHQPRLEEHRVRRGIPNVRHEGFLAEAGVQNPLPEMRDQETPMDQAVETRVLRRDVVRDVFVVDAVLQDDEVRFEGQRLGDEFHQNERESEADDQQNGVLQRPRLFKTRASPRGERIQAAVSVPSTRIGRRPLPF